MFLQFSTVFSRKSKIDKKSNFVLSLYLNGLLFCSKRKNCSTIAEKMGVNHDAVYAFYRDPCLYKSILKDSIDDIANSLPTDNGKWYIAIDEVLIEKEFSENIESASFNWSGIRKGPVKGLSVVAAVLTNGKVTIPLGFRQWFSKKRFPDKHKTRIELAIELMIEFKDRFPDATFVLDGAFTSKMMLSFCGSNKIRYCMRFHANRRVIINGYEEQIRYHNGIKISGKRKQRFTIGYYKGVMVFFAARRCMCKNGKEKTVYLVTNEGISANEAFRAYKHRWPVEKFFRTVKQHIGLKDCQARSAKKQEVHFFAVIFIYALLEMEKFSKKAKNPEQILHKIRLLQLAGKPIQFETFFSFTRKTFLCSA